MALTDVRDLRQKSSSVTGGIVKVLLIGLFSILATIGGIALLAVALYPDKLAELVTRRELWAWKEFDSALFVAVVKFIVQSGGFLLFSIALLIAVLKIDKVSKIVSDFLQARGNIYNLVTSIESVEKHGQRISEQAGKVADLKPMIEEMSERLQDALTQIGELQRLPVSERVDATAPDAAGTQTSRSVEAVPAASQSDENWERLRYLWNANGARLDQVIRNIGSRRRRQRFMSMSRTNYPQIIEDLAKEGFISPAVRQASLDLHKTFMSYKPRNRAIPDDVIANVVLFDKLLEQELRMNDAEPQGSTKDTVENEPAPVS